MFVCDFLTFGPACRLTAFVKPFEIPSRKVCDFPRLQVLVGERLVEVEQTDEEVEEGAEPKEDDGHDGDGQLPAGGFQGRRQHRRGVGVPGQVARVDGQRRRVQAAVAFGGDQDGDNDQYAVEDAREQVDGPERARQRPAPADVFLRPVHPVGHFSKLGLDVGLDAAVDHGLRLAGVHGERRGKRKELQRHAQTHTKLSSHFKNMDPLHIFLDSQRVVRKPHHAGPRRDDARFRRRALPKVVVEVSHVQVRRTLDDAQQELDRHVRAHAVVVVLSSVARLRVCALWLRTHRQDMAA